MESSQQAHSEISSCEYFLFMGLSLRGGIVQCMTLDFHNSLYKNCVNKICYPMTNYATYSSSNKNLKISELRNTTDTKAVNEKKNRTKQRKKATYKT